MKTPTFKQFYKEMSLDEVTALAEKANTTPEYLYALSQGHRKAGITTIAKLKRADGRITDAMLRPDLYA